MDVLDIHAHVIPKAFEKIINLGVIKGVQIVGNKIIFSEGQIHPYTPQFYSEKARFDFMASKGIACMAISISPRLFFYHLPDEQGAEIAAVFNDELIDVEKRQPQKQIAVGTLPLQNVELAIKELVRLSQNNVRMIQLGTTINGVLLSDQRYEALWAAAEKLNITVMLHPLITGDFPLMQKYHMSNLAGNPWQTTVAAEDLIFSGVFQRYPKLCVVLVHGGGFLPYQLGRMCHGFSVRNECKNNIDKSPEMYFKKNLYFDTITHSKKSLDFLISVAGQEHVLFGSDYPYDMAEYDQQEKMQQLGIAQCGIEQICSGNAKELLGRTV